MPADESQPASATGWRWFGAALSLAPHLALGAAAGCGQGPVEALLGAPPPPGPSRNYIVPRQPARPFYQWESNDGYCGETSLMTGGLVNGQWMSQYNARLVCGAFSGPETQHGGASLLQAGNPLHRNPNYNAQLLIEDPQTGVSGPDDFAHAALCGLNARLATETYPYATGYRRANLGLDGYRDYLHWIKSQLIAGHQVTVAVYMNGGTDAQYDHEVSVLKIGTSHAPTDDRYYGDDVLYFDDHGAYTLRQENGAWVFVGNPSVPPGAGSDSAGCTPYVFGYTFDSLAHSRAGANAAGAPGYSIAIPGDRPIVTGSGNVAPDGNGVAAIRGPHNYAFAISGPLDRQHVTLPVLVTIERTESLLHGAWRANPWDGNSDPPAGYNYETPYIGGPEGACNDGACVSNEQPAPMLMTLRVTVSGLQKGRAYTLYEYDFPSLTGADTGAAAALAVPVEDYNANARLASSAVHFVADGPTFSVAAVTVDSSQVAVFRAVPAEAP